MSATPLEQACALLKNDDVVGIPTETVYGLAGHAFSEKALTKIFLAKGRPNSDPLILHIPRSWNSVSKLHEKQLIDLDSFSPKALQVVIRLMEHFWPGPLTLVLPKNPKVPDLATSGLPTVALRMPNHAIAQNLLEALQLPLAAPSANRFGRISPTSAAHVEAELGDKIPLVLDGGPCTVGLESTVVRVHADGCVRLLRPGGVSKEQLEHVIEAQVVAPLAQGVMHSRTRREVDGGLMLMSEGMLSPGLLLNHYAPAKPLHLFQGAPVDFSKEALGAKCVAILWASAKSRAEKEPAVREQWSGIEILSLELSADGDLAESAQKLFESLRAMDESKAEILFAEKTGSTQGLALAIEDRLFKASTK